MFGIRNKKKECPSCAMEVSRDEEECPFCHYEFPPEQKGTMAMAWAFIILIIIWLITRF